MIPAIHKRLLLVPVFVLLMAAVPLVDPAPVEAPASLSQKEIVGVTRKTLITRGWLITKDSSGELDAKLDVRTHVIRCRFAIADHKIHIKYVDSVNMDYKLRHDGTAVIHRKYPGWINNVVSALNRELQLATLEKSNSAR
jgi:hypothetical protein